MPYLGNFLGILALTIWLVTLVLCSFVFFSRPRATKIFKKGNGHFVVMKGHIKCTLSIDLNKLGRDGAGSMVHLCENKTGFHHCPHHKYDESEFISPCSNFYEVGANLHYTANTVTLTVFLSVGQLGPHQFNLPKDMSMPVGMNFDVECSVKSGHLQLCRMKDIRVRSGLGSATWSLGTNIQVRTLVESLGFRNKVEMYDLPCTIVLLEPRVNEVVSSLAVNSVGQDLLRYLENTPEDVTIVCGDKEFKAHKSVLSMRSDVFKAMLMNEGRFEESRSRKITITDVEPNIMRLFLDFLHCRTYLDLEQKNEDGSDINKVKIYCSLLLVANKYNVVSLESHCREKIVADVDVKNCIVVLKTLYACSGSLKEVDKDVFEFVVQNKSSIRDKEIMAIQSYGPELFGKLLELLLKNREDK